MATQPKESEKPDDLGRASSRLTENKSWILKLWADKVLQQVAVAKGQDQPTLYNSIPDLLDLMARRIQSGPFAHYTEEVMEVPKLHGLSRARNPAYELDHVIAEYHLLRTSIFEILEETETLPGLARAVINDLIDLGMSISAREFMRVQLTRERLNRYYLELFNEIANLIIPAGNHFDVLESVMELIRGYLEADAGALLIQDPETRAVIKSACVGGSSELAERFRNLVMSYQQANPPGDSRITILSKNLTLGAARVQPFLHEGFESVLGLKLVSRDRPLGICFLGFRKERRFDENERDRLDLLASRLSLLMENARLYAQSRQDVSDLKAERQTREGFVTQIATNLRSPLSAAKVMNEVLIRQLPARDEARRLLAGKILANIERTHEMIGDFIDANQLHVGLELHLEMEECDLREIAEEAVKILNAIHGSRFELRAPAQVRGFWNRASLRRVLLNFGDNAVRSGGMPSPISIELTQNQAGTQLSVHTQGPALPERKRKEAFELYHQFRRENLLADGWGIGLALVRGIAEAHGGKAEIESSEASGNIFRLRIPNDSRPILKKSA